MSKSIKYIFVIILSLGFIFITNNAFATASGCGDSGQGKCRTSCGPYIIPFFSPNCNSGDTPGREREDCCVPTVCSFNTTGIGDCKNSSSCESGSGKVGLNTSDCLPPKICCVYPTGNPGSQVNENPTTVSPGTNSLTGETTGQDGSSGSKWAGLVPCQGFDCTLCDFLSFFQNLITYFTELIFALAGGFIVWGAIEIMTSGGSEEKVKSGKNRATVAIYGIAIALAAWLFIGTVFQLLTNSSSKVPWNEIECSSK